MKHHLYIGKCTKYIRPFYDSRILILVIFGFASCLTAPAQMDTFNPESAPDSCVLLGGSINTFQPERDFVIKRDGSGCFFSRGDLAGRRCLMGSQKDGEGWNEPEILSFSGHYDDIEPALSPDESTLYFASNRPLPGEDLTGDYNIWKSKLTYEGWQEPVPLDSVINSTANEYYPSLNQSGDIYFTSDRKGGFGLEDIYVSKWRDGKFTMLQPLGPGVNSSGYEFNAWISPNDQLIIFSGYGRQDGEGGGDLYYCNRDKNGNWTGATNMGSSINSSSLDYCPFVDIPRGIFYFTSKRSEQDAAYKNEKDMRDRVLIPENGLDNIYKIAVSSTPLHIYFNRPDTLK